MRKLTLDLDLLAVQSFRTTPSELAQPTIGPTIPDSPLCVPSVPNDCY